MLKDDLKNSDEMGLGRRSSTPISAEEIQESPKERRRFTFSFLERNKNNAGNTENNAEKSTNPVNQDPPNEATKTETLTNVTTASAGPLVQGSTTPTKSSLRSRMIEKFMGKSPAASSTPIAIDKNSSAATG